MILFRQILLICFINFVTQNTFNLILVQWMTTFDMVMNNYMLDVI